MVQILDSRELGFHPFGELAQEIIRLKEEHVAIQFQHVYKEVNAIADYLAHAGLDFPYGTHWFDSRLESATTY